MKTRLVAAMMTLLGLATLGSTPGCIEQSATSPLGGSTDSIPVRPLPPTSPTPAVPVAFTSSDSGVAGATAELRWFVGNEGSEPRQVDYTLTCALSWPGLPLHGSIVVPGESVALLATPVAVPGDAAPGLVVFTMTVTRPNGSPPGKAEGWLRVF
jgi:hypothetical protein